MTESERDRWDGRYASGVYQPKTEPSEFLVDAIRLMPPGPALVLACGAGRNAIRLAEAGFDVKAVDISSIAIDVARAEADRRGVSVDFTVADLDATELEPGIYRLVTMIRYVNRDLWPRAVKALAPHGWMVMEQHLRTHQQANGPQDDAFRVGPGELLTALSMLRTVHYSERLEVADGDRRWVLARYLGCNGDPGW